MTDNPIKDNLDQETRDLVRDLFKPTTGRGLFAPTQPDQTDTDNSEDTP